MEVMVLVTGFLLSAATTLLLVPMVRSMAYRRGWVDQPDAVRKLHARPVPAMGGIAIAAGFAVGLVYLSLVQDMLPFQLSLPPTPALLSLAIMVGVGFYDDIRGLGFKGKLLVQIVVAYMLLQAGYRIDVSHFPFVPGDPYEHALLSMPLTMLWIVGVINAVNLLDGLDGLASGVVLIAFTCLAVTFGFNGDIGLIAVAVLIGGALLGFLAYNFNPASIFMGDSGSLFLGCLLAVYSLSGKMHADANIALLIPVVALGLPILDTGMSIIRRLAERKSICAPDRDHIHHRLLRYTTHRQVVLILYAVALWFGTAAVLMAVLPPEMGMGVLAVTAVAACSGLGVLGYWRLELGRRVRARYQPAVDLYQPAVAERPTEHVPAQLQLKGAVEQRSALEQISAVEENDAVEQGSVVHNPGGDGQAGGAAERGKRESVPTGSEEGATIAVQHLVQQEHFLPHIVTLGAARPGQPG